MGVSTSIQIYLITYLITTSNDNTIESTGELLQDLHIVPAHDVQSKNNLFHSLTRAEHSLKAVVQNQVDCLIETF